MLKFAIVFAFACIGTALLLNFWRLFRGPSPPDRILVFDTHTSIPPPYWCCWAFTSIEPSISRRPCSLPRWGLLAPWPYANTCCGADIIE